ncbi:hypothetical protein CLW00_101156 [Mongoliibacter ruber]|uniref:Uncharacterized protein n=1 Tax=Mongoliibacter ruber TaxID=1750599 RepID=A0A2T0WUY3_9BACT|nr:hypothetical protein CLW00_101156 [Mongoliibacter ruber]
MTSNNYQVFARCKNIGKADLGLVSFVLLLVSNLVSPHSLNHSHERTKIR